MSARRRWGLLASFVACSCGGGEDSLVLLATPETVAADGESLVELEARVVFRGEPIPDGRRVTFRADVPLLFDSLDDATPDEPGTLPSGASEVGVSTRGGGATAFVRAPAERRTVLVEASMTTPNRDVLTSTFELEVGPPPPIAAGIPATAADPCALLTPTFALSCARQNVGGFVDSRPEIVVDCAVLLRDATGAERRHVPVSLIAEAGVLRSVAATPSEPRRFEYVVAAAPGALPRDVSPHADEASLTEGGAELIPGAAEQNPRDGLVTLLAVVRADEAYFDGNGNGRYDAGEIFCDEGEPFLDVDDDGVYDPRVDTAGFDNDGDADVDGVNGKWDGGVLLGRTTHVLWSGPVSQSRSLMPAGVSIAAGGNADVDVAVMDANGNPVAAADDSDDVTFRLTPSAIGFAAGVPSAVPLVDTTGLVLVNQFPGFRFGVSGAAAFAGFPDVQSAAYGRRWALELVDKRTTTTSRCQDTAWTLSATVTHTVADERGGAVFDRQAVLTGTGSLQAATTGCP